MQEILFKDIQVGDVITVEEVSPSKRSSTLTAKVTSKGSILGVPCYRGVGLTLLERPNDGVTRVIRLAYRLTPPAEELSVIKVTWTSSWDNIPERQTLHFFEGKWLGVLGVYTTSELLAQITGWEIVLASREA